MAVRQARGVQARPGRAPAAALWRTGPHFCGAHCAPLQGAQVSAQGVQNAETVAANIVRHGRSSGEGRTGPAGTCAPPRFRGERVRIFCGAQCAPLQGHGFWRRSAVLRRTGPHFCGAQCAPLQGVRGLAQARGFAANRAAFCGARCAPLQGGGFAAHGAAPDFSCTGPDSIVHYQGGVQVEPRWSSDEDSKQSMNKL